MAKVVSIRQKRQERIVQSAQGFLADLMSGEFDEDDLERRMANIDQAIRQEQAIEESEEVMTAAERLYTPEQVAEHLSKSKKSIMEYLRAGMIKGVKVGREWRVRERDLQAYIDGLTNDEQHYPEQQA